MSGPSRICHEPGCLGPHRARGLCSAHYQSARRRSLSDGTWDVLDDPRRYRIACPICGKPTFAGSSRPVSWGRAIYRRCGGGHGTVWARGKDGLLSFVHESLTHDDMRDDRPCDFPGCGRPRKSSYCQGHCKQRQRHGESGMRPLLGPHGRKP